MRFGVVNCCPVTGVSARAKPAWIVNPAAAIIAAPVSWFLDIGAVAEQATNSRPFITESPYGDFKDRSVHPEDIHYYDAPPFDDGNHLARGVDLAISTEESADRTAIVSRDVTWPNGNIEIYIQPHPIIRHMTFNTTMQALDGISKSSVMSSESFVKTVAHQQVAIERWNSVRSARKPCTR
jgi:hypothetical protein